MIFTGDYHTHTTVSDGKNTIFENAAVALENQLKLMAVTDHGFTSFKYHSSSESLDKQREEAIEIRQKQGLEVLVGIEANILGDGTIDMPKEDIKKLDLLIVGFHRFVEKESINHGKDFILVNGFGTKAQREKRREKNTEIYLKMLDEYPVDILAHLNHRCLVDVKRIAEKCVEKNVYIELNEKHIATLEDDIETLKESGVQFVIGSDSHKAENIGIFKNVLTFMVKHDVPINRIAGLNHQRVILKPKN